MSMSVDVWTGQWRDQWTAGQTFGLLDRSLDYWTDQCTTG